MLCNLCLLFFVALSIVIAMPAITKKMKQRTDTKNKTKKIKSDNCILKN